MTENQWLTGTAPGKMFPCLQGTTGGRKFRLHACACCRRLWHRLPDGPSRRVVEVAERYADGAATAAEWGAAADQARATLERVDADIRNRPRRGSPWTVADWWAALAVRQLFRPSPYGSYGVAWAVGFDTAAAAVTAGWTWDDPAWQQALHGAWERAFFSPPPFDQVQAASEVGRHVGPDVFPRPLWDAEQAAHAGLLRDLFGNPFRPPAAVDPAWLRWNGGTVPRLARSAYEERAFDRLPILADALEEAGCADPAILGHLRGPGPHARGCWAVDALLGRE